MVDLVGITIGAVLSGHAVATLIASRLPRDQVCSSPRGRIATQAPIAPPNSRILPPDASGDGVRKTGAHSYEITRAAQDQFLRGGTTPPWPRIVPQTRDGAPIGARLSVIGPDGWTPIGLRLFGIGRDGPFAAIGLASGDLLLEVNGRSIATPDAALAAFTSVRTASHVWLLVERDGRRIRMDYAIR